MYFPYYGLRKTWLNESLKSPLSQDPWRSNMLRGIKNLGNLNGTTFTILIDHYGRKGVGKTLS